MTRDELQDEIYHTVPEFTLECAAMMLSMTIRKGYVMDFASQGELVAFIDSLDVRGLKRLRKMARLLMAAP